MIGREKNVQAISKMRMTFNFPSITKMRRSFAIYFLRKIFEGYSNRDKERRKNHPNYAKRYPEGTVITKMEREYTINIKEG